MEKSMPKTKWVKGPINLTVRASGLGGAVGPIEVETSTGYILVGSGIGVFKLLRDIWSITHLASGLKIDSAPRMADARRMAEAAVREEPRLGLDTAKEISRWQSDRHNRVRSALDAARGTE